MAANIATSMETDKFPTLDNATSRYNSVGKVMALLLPALVPDTFSPPRND